MTSCYAAIAKSCSGTVDRVRRLAEVRDPVAMCGACEEAARTLGMDPTRRLDESRQGVTRRERQGFVPAWRRRDLAKDLTGVGR